MLLPVIENNTFIHDVDANAGTTIDVFDGRRKLNAILLFEIIIVLDGGFILFFMMISLSYCLYTILIATLPPDKVKTLSICFASKLSTGIDYIFSFSHHCDKTAIVIVLDHGGCYLTSS